MELDISDDATSARLRCNSTFDAEALGVLINRLAQLRSQMQPPYASAWTADTTIDVASDPAMNVELTRESRLLMSLRHPGFGWCSFDFGLQQAAHLRDFIAKRTVGVKPVGDVDEADVGNPH